MLDTFEYERFARAPEKNSHRVSMSSYQFVNSLASSCYVGRGGAAAAGADLSGMSAADYYATAMSNYQNCYPQAQQAQHYADFGHLGQQAQVQHPQHAMPMSPMSNGGVDFSMAHHVQQQQPIQQQQQQPGIQQQQQSMRPASSQRLNSVASPVNLGGTSLVAERGNRFTPVFCFASLEERYSTLGGSGTTPSSCKYAVVPDNKCLGSPQDLSLTNSTPTNALAHLTAAQNSLPGASSGAPSKAHDGKSGKQSNGQRHHSAKSAPGASSPSSPSSVSSGSSEPQSPGGQSEGSSKNANAPQIYPWMKRVHLGQSKSLVSPFTSLPRLEIESLTRAGEVHHHQDSPSYRPHRDQCYAVH